MWNEMNVLLHLLDFILSNLEKFDKFIKLLIIFSNLTLQFFKLYLLIYSSYFTAYYLNLIFCTSVLIPGV